jgi:hypothetical protein
MQIDWLKAIEDIFENEMTCPRCHGSSAQLLAGYSYEAWAVECAPRCEDCPDKEDCEARKLIFLCDACSKELRVRAKLVDQNGMMSLLLEDCRDDLDGCVDYLAEEWAEELDVEPEEVALGLAVIAPDVLQDETELRERFENQYLSYHQWFRAHKVRIPDPEWRSKYVEEIIGLGHTTALGD